MLLCEPKLPPSLGRVLSAPAELQVLVSVRSRVCVMSAALWGGLRCTVHLSWLSIFVK